MNFLFALMLYAFAPDTMPKAIPLPAAQFATFNVEISGLATHQGHLLALSEGCGKLFIVPLDGKGCGKKCGEIALEGQYGKDLEGMAIYNNYLFVTNEDYPAGIQFSKLGNVSAGGTLTFKPVITRTGTEMFDLTDNTGDFGLEGIAIDADKGVAYIIKERSSKGKKGAENHSMLWAFTIDEVAGMVTFNHLSTTKISHPDPMFRYSDIYFHNGKLYAIRSKGSTFYVDIISSPGKLGTNISTTHPQIQSVSITNQVQSVKGNNSDRLEGITILGNKVYLVSDTGSGNCEKEVSKGTLLMEMSLF